MSGIKQQLFLSVVWSNFEKVECKAELKTEIRMKFLCYQRYISPTLMYRPVFHLRLVSLSFSENQTVKGRASSCSNNFFSSRGLKPSLLSTLAGEIRCLQAFKRSPIMTESSRKKWKSELFPSQRPALQLLAVDSIHFRKWIACGAFPKSWVSSFVVGSHSYFLIEAFFLPLSVLPPA